MLPQRVHLPSGRVVRLAPGRSSLEGNPGLRRSIRAFDGSVVRVTDEHGAPFGKPYVAIDTVDAGAGDLVLTAAGSSARQTDITKDTPVDAVIMAIIDTLEVDGAIAFQKSA